jgi:tryptophan halogenase
MRRIDKALVLGGGSAGFLTALALKSKVPGLDVTVIRSPDIGIIGVGEGTTVTMPVFLHGYLGIDMCSFHRAVQPTYKLGIQFLWGPHPKFHYTFDGQLNWRYDTLPKPNGFYCVENFDYANVSGALMAHNRAFERQNDSTPFIPVAVAYHLENEPFVKFLERHAVSTGVHLIDDTMIEVEQGEQGVVALKLASGNRATADLYVDCSGFRSRLLSGVFQEPFISFKSSLFCDRAVVGGWTRTTEPLRPYTTAETMNCGWAWQIEHERVINRGYVYSSDFITDEEAEREFREKNPKVTSVRTLRFTSGKYRNSWVKNVVAIGNASGFVEPLESTSLAIICNQAARLVIEIMDSDREIRPAQVALFNRTLYRWWDAVRRFLAVHYKFNTRLNTPFWHASREKTDLAGAEEFVDYYQNVGPTIHGVSLLDAEDPFHLEGYLTLLVGQRVPYHETYKPSKRELDGWTAIKNEYTRRAWAAMSQEEALQVIRSDYWQWNPEFYRSVAPWR